MSYILEALKKAQAERQIGSTPTIHAPTLAAAQPGQGARSKRIPVIVAMVLMATAIAGLAAMLVRQQSGASQAQTAPVAAAPAVNRQQVAVPAAAQPPAVAAAPAAVAQPVPVQPPVAAPAVAAAQAPAPRALPQPAVQQAAQPQPVPPAPQASAPAPAAPQQASAGAAVEEPVQALRELPEPIQRAIPQIALGGYMYSKNPADRLLLIDKVLRREGEEVAPGLVLEKLQPKQAVFAFRGYRYRVPL